MLCSHFKNFQSDGWAALPNIPCYGPAYFAASKIFFGFNVMQIFNSVQMNGWGCSPKHGPAQFTALSQLFVRIVWNLSKTFEFLAGSCSPKHGPLLVTVSQKLFVGMFCSHFKNSQVDGWATLPNIPCHGPAHVAALNIFFWCCAVFEQRSNGRLVVLPQTRSSSKQGVESIFRPDGVKHFKNIPLLGWVVLPQTRPSSFYGVTEPFRLDVMQPFQEQSSWWLGRAPQYPLSRPSSFHGVIYGYRFDVMQTFNNVQLNGWSCSPKHGPAHRTVLSQLFVRMAWSSLKTFKF